VLNILPVYRSLFETELESVELGGIVRPGDLNSAYDVKIVLSPICERRGNDPDVDHVQSALEQSRNKLAYPARYETVQVSPECSSASSSGVPTSERDSSSEADSSAP